MARYRAGAIGSTGRGNWGHGLDTAFVGVKGVEFVAVADDDPDGLRDAGSRTGAGSLYGDYREMLEREKLDFVAVCPRWLGARTEMVIAATEAGVKGLFCEKPFARTLADADAMLEACERAGTRVAVAHRRANPYEQRAKTMVERGAIGELQSLRGQGKCDHRSGGAGPDGAGDAHDGQHEVRGGLGCRVGERARDTGRAGRYGGRCP